MRSRENDAPPTFDEIRSLARFPDENPNPVLRLGYDGRVLYANEPALPLLAVWGCAVGGLVPDDIAAELDAVGRTRASREHLARYGSRTFALNITPVDDAGYVNVYGSDVTARLRAEAHTASIARFPDENPSPVLRVSRDGEVIYANRSSAALLHHIDSGPGRRLPLTLRGALATAFETASPHEVEVACGDDTFALNFVPIASEGYANIYCANITRRNAALLKARDDAREASRAKSAFLANMSHELRTPLNAIIGYSELLLEEAGEMRPDELVPDLQKIRAAGKHLLDLINGILDLSKIEAGKMDVYVEPIDVCAMLDEIAATLAPLVAKSGNRLELCKPEPSITMRTDVVKVRQALFNLVGNAAKFTKDGVVRLSAELDDRFVAFTVADTGIGMTAEQLGRIFTPFTQADGSTTRKYGGTGLGLTITKQFCDMLGGSISVTSAVNEGTTFRLRFPIEIAPVPLGEKSIAVGAADDLTEGRDVVLVIDDDPIVAETLRGTLRRAGFAVACAASGDEGIRLARELRPCVITLDVVLPGKDGWQVLMQLKADPATADIPVVLATILDERALGFELGAAAYMVKPIDRARLLRVLEPLRKQTGPRTVLVVEDDPDTRELLRRAMSEAGWQVVEADNGEVALQRLEEATPSVLIVDLMMPVLDGFELVARVRADHRWKDLPIVVATAKDLNAEDHARLSGRVADVLRKGAFELSDLVREVDRHVRAHARGLPSTGGAA